METNEERPVIRTYLSNAPAKGAGTWALWAIAVAILFSWLSWDESFGAARFLTASREQIFEQGEFWRLFTAPWVHADPDHLLSNLPFLAGLVFLVSGYYGLRAFPVVTVLAGAVIEAATLYLYPGHVTLVGASGMVYFLGSFWLMMYFLIEKRRRSLAQRILGCIGLALATLAPHEFEPHVSYAAHAIGFALGTVAALALFPGLRERLQAAEVRAPLPAPPTPLEAEQTEAELIGLAAH